MKCATKLGLFVVLLATNIVGGRSFGDEPVLPEGTRYVHTAENGHAVVAMSLPISSSSERVWALVTDYGNSRVAEEIAEDVLFDGDESGGIRTIVLKPELGGGSVSELIYDVSNVTRSLHYTLLDMGKSPFADYQGYMKIVSAGVNRSVVYYNARIFPTTISVDDAAGFAVRNMLAFQKSVNALLARQPDSK